MKLIRAIAFSATILFLVNCSKAGDSSTRLINCDGLVTDTAGTGDNGRIYMPNAFTPNNDGVNEFCRPLLRNIASMVFTIYDENNIVLFTTTIPGQGWQPAPPQGSNSAKKYYYRIQATTMGNRKIGVCGDVYSLTCFPINPPKSFYYFEDMLTINGFTGVTIESLPTCY
jgi:hypothetical protein